MKNSIRLILIAGIGILASCKGKNRADVKVTDVVITRVDSTPGPQIDRSGNQTIDNFQIHIPNGWETNEDERTTRHIFYLLGPKEMNYQTNINILKDPMKGESLDDYIKVSLGKMQSMQITIGPTGTFSANGIQGKYLKYIYTAKDRMIAVKSYVFPKNDTAYIVTATTLPQLGKKYEPVFDKAVSTFKVN